MGREHGQYVPPYGHNNVHGYENGMRMLNVFLSSSTCKSFSFAKQALQTNFSTFLFSKTCLKIKSLESFLQF